jgi:hypothetical protein
MLTEIGEFVRDADVLSFSPDGRLLISKSLKTTNADRDTVILWGINE